GPLSNPAGARHQVVGVFAAEWTEPLAQALGRLGSTHALVVHGEDGLDEISLAAPTQISEWKAGSLRTYRATPEEFGLAHCKNNERGCGDVEAAATIMRDIMAGARGACTDIAVLNAAAAIHVSGLSESIAAGVDQARESLDSGRAARKLEQLIAFSNR